MLYVYARLFPRNEVVMEFKKMVGRLVEKTRLEPGCAGFEFLGCDDGRSYALAEKFEDRNAFDAHIRAEHYKELFPKIIALLDRPIEPMFHQVIG